MTALASGTRSGRWFANAARRRRGLYRLSHAPRPLWQWSGRERRWQRLRNRYLSSTTAPAPRKCRLCKHRWSVSAEVTVSAVLVEDQVLAISGPELQRQHLRAQPSIRIHGDRAAHATRPHTVPFRKRPAQPVVRVQPRPLAQPRPPSSYRTSKRTGPRAGPSQSGPLETAR